jgi:hypothetical protein
VITKEDKGTNQRQRWQCKDPIGQLPPMHVLHGVEIIRADEPPGRNISTSIAQIAPTK